MANTSVFIPAGVSIVTDEGLTGGGTLGSPLSVVVDDSTIIVNGSNQLESTGAAVAFKTIAVAGQSDIVADAADDTLTVVAGANITLTTNAGTDTLTITATGGGASPAGSGSEINARLNETTFQAVTGSSWDGTQLGLPAMLSGAAGAYDSTPALAFTNGSGLIFNDGDLEFLNGNSASITGVVPVSAIGPSVADVVYVSVSTGAITAGKHLFVVTYTGSGFETMPGPAQSQTFGSNRHVAFSNLPVSMDGSVTGRNIYMTKANSPTVFYLAATVADNSTTSGTISVADGSLPNTHPPVTEGTNDVWFVLNRLGWEIGPSGFNSNSATVPYIQATAVPGGMAISGGASILSIDNFTNGIQLNASGGDIVLNTFGHNVTSDSAVAAPGFTISGLTTPTNKPVCFDASGNLYAGTNTGGVLSCP